jgi:teichuronic acid biosynthesis glycosyltransferase TuaC
MMMEMNTFRILTYTNLFPNHRQENLGVFIENRMRAFAERTGAHLDVVAPIPYFPKLPWSTRWSTFSQIESEEERRGIRIYHPQYLVVPKVGMTRHGQSMYWASYKLINRLHRANKYHLIDAHWIYPDGWAAIKIAKRLKIPVVLSARGNDINEYIEFPKIRPLIRWCLENCDHIISVCQALKDLMTPLGIPDSKITVVGNGVDIQSFYPVEREEARRKLELPSGRRMLLSVGLLEPRKGHHILIEALHLLQKQGTDLPCLYIIGTGLFHDKLEKLIHKFKLDDDVKLVGELPNRDLKFWYSAADVLCLASDREGWPNVLLEALACGTPVVASRVFGIPEIIRSKDVGSVVEQRTPEAFACHIMKTLTQSWDASKIVAFAQQHTWDKTAQAVQKVFASVLHQSGDDCDGAASQKDWQWETVVEGRL